MNPKPSRRDLLKASALVGAGITVGASTKAGEIETSGAHYR